MSPEGLRIGRRSRVLAPVALATLIALGGGVPEKIGNKDVQPATQKGDNQEGLVDPTGKAHVVFTKTECEEPRPDGVNKLAHFPGYLPGNCWQADKDMGPDDTCKEPGLTNMNRTIVCATGSETNPMQVSDDTDKKDPDLQVGPDSDLARILQIGNELAPDYTWVVYKRKCVPRDKGINKTTWYYTHTGYLPRSCVKYESTRGPGAIKVGDKYTWCRSPNTIQATVVDCPDWARENGPKQAQNPTHVSRGEQAKVAKAAYKIALLRAGQQGFK